MTITRFSFPTTIHFGPGARKLVGPHLAEHGFKRPLVVTDKGLAALPLVAELVAELRAAGLDPSVYSGVFGNPTGSQVMGGAAQYLAHFADCVVGIGGGAALGAAAGHPRVAAVVTIAAAQTRPSALDAARAHADSLRHAAHAALDASGLDEVARLRALADRAVDRES